MRRPSTSGGPNRRWEPVRSRNASSTENTSTTDVNRRKAGRLYEAIDSSAFYHSPVRPDCRSLMNVPFTLADSSLDGDFLAAADEAGLLNLKGHRSVGGMRASIYNAMPETGVTALVGFMQEFERTRG